MSARKRPPVRPDGRTALEIHFMWIAFSLVAMSPGPVVLAALKRLLDILGA